MSIGIMLVLIGLIYIIGYSIVYFKNRKEDLYFYIVVILTSVVLVALGLTIVFQIGGIILPEPVVIK